MNREPMIPNNIEYTVGEWFACAIEYGDESGLRDDESAQLADFLECESPTHPHHWTLDTDRADEFAKCEITGAMGECITLICVDMRS